MSLLTRDLARERLVSGLYWGMLSCVAVVVYSPVSLGFEGLEALGGGRGYRITLLAQKGPLCVRNWVGHANLLS